MMISLPKIVSIIEKAIVRVMSSMFKKKMLIGETSLGKKHDIRHIKSSFPRRDKNTSGLIGPVGISSCTFLEVGSYHG